MYEKREEEHGWMKELYRHWGVNDEASREMWHAAISNALLAVWKPDEQELHAFRKEKRRQVKAMISHKNVRRSLRLAKPHSFMMKVMLVPIRMKSVTLTLLEAEVITAVKSRNTKIFAALKASR